MTTCHKQIERLKTQIKETNEYVISRDTQYEDAMGELESAQALIVELQEELNQLNPEG